MQTVCISVQCCGLHVAHHTVCHLCTVQGQPAAAPKVGGAWAKPGELVQRLGSREQPESRPSSANTSRGSSTPASQVCKAFTHAMHWPDRISPALRTPRAGDLSCLQKQLCDPNKVSESSAVSLKATKCLTVFDAGVHCLCNQIHLPETASPHICL